MLPPSLSYPLLSPGACLSSPAFRVLYHVSLLKSLRLLPPSCPPHHIPRFSPLSSPQSLHLPSTLSHFAPRRKEALKDWVYGEAYGEAYREHRAAGTSPVVFQSLNPFQEGQPRTFLVTARGALRRVWFAEFLANNTSYLHLERSSSQRGGWLVSFNIHLFI